MEYNSEYIQNNGDSFSPSATIFSESQYKNQTGDDNSGFCFWCCLGSCVIKGGASVIATLGSAYLTSNANVDIAKATHQNPLNKSTGAVAPPAPAPKNHTTLYMTLGVVGVLALSGGIYLMVRKRGKYNS